MLVYTVSKHGRQQFVVKASARACIQITIPPLVSVLSPDDKPMYLGGSSRISGQPYDQYTKEGSCYCSSSATLTMFGGWLAVVVTAYTNHMFINDRHWRKNPNQNTRTQHTTFQYVLG